MRAVFITFLTIMLFLSGSVGFAQNVVKHVVAKGESLETIAQKYGVDKSDIIANNPKAERYVYVGMELQIPSKASASNQVDPVKAVVSSNTVTKQTISEDSGKEVYEVEEVASKQTQVEVKRDSRAKSVLNTFMITWNIIPGAKIADQPMCMSFVPGADYYIIDMLYIGAGLGLSYSYDSYTISGYDIKTNAYALEMPFHIGFSPWESLQLYTGPVLSIGLGGNQKTYYKGDKKDKQSLKAGDVGVRWRASINVFDLLYCGVDVGIYTQSSVLNQSSVVLLVGCAF